MRSLALVGLTGSALVMALLFPRLQPHVAPKELPSVPPHSPVPPLVIEPPPEIVPSKTEGPGTGILQLEGGLDRPVLAPGAGNERFATLEVRGPTGAGRRPVDLVVVLDVSGSMRPRPKIDGARKAVVRLAGQLEAEDRLGLVVFSDDSSVLRDLSPVHQTARVRDLLRTIAPSGGTRIEGGLKAAGALFAEQDPSRSRRIVLLSDGHDAGTSDLPEVASQLARQDISTSTIAFGYDEQEATLRAISLAGGANHHYAERGADLTEILGNELVDASRVVASQATLTLRAEAHVEVVEAMGWPLERVDDRWVVHLGDVAEGETTHVVVRTRLDGNAGTAIDATLDYFDRTLGRTARESAVLSAEVSSLPHDLERSSRWSLPAHQALASEHVERASSLLLTGQTESALRSLEAIETSTPGLDDRTRSTLADLARRVRTVSPDDPAHQAVVEYAREVAHELAR